MTGTAPRLYAIAPTSFDDHDRVDLEAIAANVETLVGRGIQDFLLTGSYGEFQSLDDDERVAITTAVRQVEGVRTLMSGASAINTAATAALATRLTDAGADLVMVAAPLAAELSDDDLLRHFGDLALSGGENLVIYNNPVFGTDLTPRQLQAIAERGGFRAVKQGTTHLASMVESILTLTGGAEPLDVLAAADLVSSAALGAGASGLTSTNCWVFPEAFVLLAAADTSTSERTRILRALRPYAEAVRALGQPRAVKEAMVQRGFAGGAHVRRPYVPLLMAERNEIGFAVRRSEELLAEIGIGESAFA